MSRWRRRLAAPRCSRRKWPRPPHLPPATDTGAIEMRSRAVSKSLLAVMLPLVLSGCVVGPNYARPELPTPDQYRFVEGTAQAQSLADAPWYQIFDDPTLQALVRDALANNLDLKM